MNPGDEVVIFEPYFPWYVPHVRLAGGIPKLVRLKPPAFGLDVEEVTAAFSDKTKLVTPPCIADRLIPLLAQAACVSAHSVSRDLGTPIFSAHATRHLLHPR